MMAAIFQREAAPQVAVAAPQGGNGTANTTPPAAIVSTLSMAESSANNIATSFAPGSTSFATQAPSTVIQSPVPSASSVVVSAQSPTVIVVTSQVSLSNGQSSSAGVSIVTITSTASVSRPATTAATRTVTPSSSSATTNSNAAALATGSTSPSGSGKLSPGGKIAIAVVVPVAAVAIILLLALIFWRKRKQRKEAEDLRRKEVEEYGFNPNHDPTLPVVGGASSNGDDGEMTQKGSSGYRGWGTTSTARKASTTLSSGNGAIGIARSTSGSDNDRYANGSPNGGTNHSSDVHSNDPLIAGSHNQRPESGDMETVAALGAVPSNENRQNNVKRGPSNASSAYSGAHKSDTSGDVGLTGGPSQNYYNEGMYYDEGMPQHGPYGDGSYGGGQPVIRDVPARRNTRIENPAVVPPQGSAGIAQNF